MWRVCVLLILAACAQHASAEEGGEEQAQASSGSASAHTRVGDDSFAKGLYAQAIQFYTSAIDLDSKNSLLYTKRAAAYISMRHQSQALRDLDTSVELDPRFIQGYITRGKLLKQMCSLEAAEKDFRSVLEHRPDQKTATQELEGLESINQALVTVNAAKSVNNIPAARAALANLYELAQDCVEAQLLEAELNMLDKMYDEVVAVSGKLLKSQPKNLQALILRGKAYFYLNDHDLAKRHFGEALKFDPDCKDARTEFNKVKTFDKTRTAAERALEGKDYQVAEETFIKGLNLDPDHRQANAGLWLGLAKARSGLGRHLLAAEAYDAVVVLTEGEEQNQGKAGQIRSLLAAEEWQQASNKARAAVQENQNNREFRQLYAEAEKRLKMSLRKDYYKILGVDRGADEKEIKRAYRDLAKKHHPDKVEPGQREEANKVFHDIAEAAEVLGDPEKRRKWENGEDLDDQGGGGHHHGGGFSNFGGGFGGRTEFRFNFG